MVLFEPWKIFAFARLCASPVFADHLSNNDYFIFNTVPFLTPSLCMEHEGDVSSSQVVVGWCDFAGSTSRSTNDDVLYSYNNGLIGVSSAVCVGPSSASFEEETNNYLKLSDCEGDHMRFVLTSDTRRIQSVVNPDYCVVVITDGSGNINIGDKIALHDCSDLAGDPWRPDEWSFPRKFLQPFVFVHSETYLAGDDVIVSFIVGNNANKIDDYNITIVTNTTELSTSPQVYSLPACGQKKCTNTIISGHVTFSDTSPFSTSIDKPGDYVAIVRVGTIVYAYSAPFTISPVPPTVSPAPSTSRWPSGKPSMSHPPSEVPSNTPTDGEVTCDEVTLKQAFTQSKSLIPGIIIAIIDFLPVYCYIRQVSVGGKFYVDLFFDVAEKFFTITTLAAAFASCSDAWGEPSGDTYELLFSTAVLGCLVVVEFVVGILGFLCCASEDETVHFDSGRFVLASHWFNGWLLSLFLLAGSGFATFFQLVHVYGLFGIEASSVTEIVIVTTFLAIGLLPALFLGFLPGSLCCSSTYCLGSNDRGPGIALYQWWKWYKVIGLTIPSVIFSLLKKDFLAISWTVELVVDLIHLVLGYETF